MTAAPTPSLPWIPQAPPAAAEAAALVRLARQALRQLAPTPLPAQSTPTTHSTVALQPDRVVRVALAVGQNPHHVTVQILPLDRPTIQGQKQLEAGRASHDPVTPGSSPIVTLGGHAAGTCSAAAGPHSLMDTLRMAACPEATYSSPAAGAAQAARTADEMPTSTAASSVRAPGEAVSLASLRAEVGEGGRIKISISSAVQSIAGAAQSQQARTPIQLTAANPVAGPVAGLGQGKGPIAMGVLPIPQPADEGQVQQTLQELVGALQSYLHSPQAGRAASPQSSAAPVSPIAPLARSSAPATPPPKEGPLRTALTSIGHITDPSCAGGNLQIPSVPAQAAGSSASLLPAASFASPAAARLQAGNCIQPAASLPGGCPAPGPSSQAPAADALHRSAAQQPVTLAALQQQLGALLRQLQVTERAGNKSGLAMGLTYTMCLAACCSRRMNVNSSPVKKV